MAWSGFRTGGDNAHTLALVANALLALDHNTDAAGPHLRRLDELKHTSANEDSSLLDGITGLTGVEGTEARSGAEATPPELRDGAAEDPKSV